MSEVLLQISDLRTRIASPKGIVRAVDGVDLEVRRGETFALLGESGCGKSMTALSVMRLLPAPAGHIVGGRVSLDGQELLALPEAAMRRVRGRRVAMIFQEPQTSLNPVLTVGKQIREVVVRHRGLRGSAARRRVLALLEAVGIPDPERRLGEYPHQLSGGLKQRVMIAMALAGEPDLLIADEPTTALDVTIQAQVLVLLRELQRSTGMAILLITHDLGVVAEVADRVAVMYAGQIFEQGRRERLFAGPAHPYTRKLFASVPEAQKRGRPLAVIPGAVPSLDRAFKGCRFAERCDLAWTLCREREPDWLVTGEGGVRCHLADPQHAARPPAAAAPADLPAAAAEPASAGPLLEVRDLAVHFPIRRGVLQRVVGQVRAVDGVSLRIHSARTLALVGESGCGKTTVGKGILQLLRPSAGSVRFGDTELTRLAPRELRAQRAHLQVIFQDPYASMNPRMLVGEIVEEGLVALGLGGGSEQRRARVDELLQQCGLAPEVRQRYPHEFSGGQRQRICIARALTVGPRLVICDEPTSALDVSVQAQILNLLKDLQARMGLAFLFITHNIGVVEYLAHEVAVMYLGRIVERGPTERLLASPGHPYTQALLSAVPVVDPASRRQVIRLGGELPSPAAPPRGCHFSPRCPHVMPLCRELYPEETELGPGHLARCHLLTAKVDRAGNPEDSLSLPMRRK